jgi:hypothetical protein
MANGHYSIELSRMMFRRACVNNLLRLYVAYHTVKNKTDSFKAVSRFLSETARKPRRALFSNIKAVEYIASSEGDDVEDFLRAFELEPSDRDKVLSVILEPGFQFEVSGEEGIVSLLGYLAILFQAEADRPLVDFAWEKAAFAIGQAIELLERKGKCSSDEQSRISKDKRKVRSGYLPDSIYHKEYYKILKEGKKPTAGNIHKNLKEWIEKREQEGKKTKKLHCDKQIREILKTRINSITNIPA